MTDLAAILTDEKIRRRLETLAPDFNGRVTLIYQDGCFQRLEITESLKPIVDRARSPIAK
jgi:hypothetical protein